MLATRSLDKPSCRASGAIFTATSVRHFVRVTVTVQCGHASLTDAECRSHFGLWAIAKAPLILGSDVRKMTPTQLAIVGAKEVGEQ
jgi:hypothetical protein